MLITTSHSNEMNNEEDELNLEQIFLLRIPIYVSFPSAQISKGNPILFFSFSLYRSFSRPAEATVCNSDWNRRYSALSLSILSLSYGFSFLHHNISSCSLDEKTRKMELTSCWISLWLWDWGGPIVLNGKEYEDSQGKSYQSFSFFMWSFSLTFSFCF